MVKHCPAQADITCHSQYRNLAAEEASDRQFAGLLSQSSACDCLSSTISARPSEEKSRSNCCVSLTLRETLARRCPSSAVKASVGPAIDDVRQLDLPRPEKEVERLVSGGIIHLNCFGTLVTNIHHSFLEGLKVKSVEVGTFNIGPLSKTYSDLEPGYPLALYGSAGYLEVAYNGDSAEARLDLGVGIIVKVAVEAA